MNGTTPGALRHGRTLEERRAAYEERGIDTSDLDEEMIDLVDDLIYGLRAIEARDGIAARDEAKTEFFRAVHAQEWDARIFEVVAAAASRAA